MDRPVQYRIGPLDILSVSVFQEPELTIPEISVDASGTILYPLIGSVQAAGLTSRELALSIARELGKRYLVNPQVSVSIRTSSTRRVTVEGAVLQPGVYDIAGQLSLIDAIALARGPSTVARLGEVIVFRRVNGQRMGAMFNLRDIRRGEANDPEILPGDQIVVGLDNARALFRDALTAAPLLNIFRPF